jgi:hypothetical protein
MPLKCHALHCFSDHLEWHTACVNHCFSYVTQYLVHARRIFMENILQSLKYEEAEAWWSLDFDTKLADSVLI